MLKVWGRKSSSNVQAVMWCIAELGLECKRIDAGLTYGVVDTPEYLAMNPNGTIPTLKDGDAPAFWESGAIMRYLATNYAAEEFWPSDPVARADTDRWAEWSKLNIALRFTAPIFWAVVRTPESRRDPAAIRAGLAVLDKFLGIADGRLRERQFMMGDNITLADIQFGHCLYRYFTIDIARSDHPHIRRYYDDLGRRPAYRDHVMVSYDELRDID